MNTRTFGKAEREFRRLVSIIMQKPVYDLEAALIVGTHTTSAACSPPNKGARDIFPDTTLTEEVGLDT